MHGYKCIVRLNGELGQEVPKANIPAAHVVMLIKEHGDDAVHSIERTTKQLEWTVEGKKKPVIVTQSMVREFLESEFTEEKVAKTFGSFFGSLLPETFPGFEGTVSMKKKSKPTPAAKTESEDADLEIAEEDLDDVEDPEEDEEEEEEEKDEETL